MQYINKKLDGPEGRGLGEQIYPGQEAATAGLQHGDRIIEVGDREAQDWETTLLTMIDEMVEDGRIPLKLKAENGTERLAVIDVGADSSRLTEPGLLFDGLGFAPWQPPAVVASVEEGGAADIGGIQADDVITSIDGEAVLDFFDLQRIVSARPEQTVPIGFERDGRAMSTEVTIALSVLDGETRGLLGVAVSRDSGDLRYDRKYGPLTAIAESAQQTWTTTAFTVRMLANMLTGDVSIKNISGPISIAQYAGDSAAAGFDRFLRFLALISISLGALNLLPVPILDGGQIVYQTIEWLKGSPLSMRSQIVGQQVGILALLILMSFAFYNDIARLLG